MDQTTRTIRCLINELNNATKAYDEGRPYVTDEYWDHLYFELKKLEEQTGVVYPDSPTHSISYKVVSELQKKEHEYRPMLSLAKTKEPKEVEKFCFAHKEYWDWFAMFKLDGLSCRLTYSNGVLVGAETRGDGETGEWILHNAKVITNIPKQIPHKEETVIIDGEIICKLNDFEKFKDVYKNPRNLAAGSIRLLDSKECARRNLSFVAWDLIKGCEDIDFNFHRLETLDDWGFETVPRVGDAETIEDAINILDRDEGHKIYPIDGYVFKFESKKFCDNLGRTDHHFNSAIAFKFYDEEYETELLDIEWGMSRLGQLTPVAIFKPVEIEGSTVERANLHNLSMMQELLGEYPEQEQKIWVVKSNQIIPQITRAIKNDIPHDHILNNGIINICPICGSIVKIVCSDSGVQNIICPNENCSGKLCNRIDYYFSKKGLNVKGISLATIEKLINWGWINNIEDMYFLRKYQKEWINKPGFGEASVNKILDAIDLSRDNVDLVNFIAALGIPLVGKTIAKEIVKYYSTWDSFRSAVGGDWEKFNGFGPEINRVINTFDYTEADNIATHFLTFAETEIKDPEAASALKDKIFVITGKTNHFKNRDELKENIEFFGGKVASSVTSKTNYLINNDNTSNSAKNKKAKELGIAIITEEEYLKMKS